MAVDNHACHYLTGCIRLPQIERANQSSVCLLVVNRNTVLANPAEHGAAESGKNLRMEQAVADRLDPVGTFGIKPEHRLPVLHSDGVDRFVAIAVGRVRGQAGGCGQIDSADPAEVFAYPASLDAQLLCVGQMAQRAASAAVADRASGAGIFAASGAGRQKLLHGAVGEPGRCLDNLGGDAVAYRSVGHKDGKPVRAADAASVIGNIVDDKLNNLIFLQHGSSRCRHSRPSTLK